MSHVNRMVISVIMPAYNVELAGLYILENEMLSDLFDGNIDRPLVMSS